MRAKAESAFTTEKHSLKTLQFLVGANLQKRTNLKAFLSIFEVLKCIVIT